MKMSLTDEDRDRPRGIYEGDWYVGKPLFTKYINLTDLPRWKPNEKEMGMQNRHLMASTVVEEPEETEERA